MPNCGGGQCPIGGATEGQINGGTAQISGLTQTAYACALTLGVNTLDSGKLSVDHGTLDVCGEIFVGSHGTGGVSITNGGLVSTDVGAEIASFAGSNGAVTVDGTNPDGRKSTWTVIGGGMYVGGTNTSAGGTGLLTVTNGAQVTAASVYVYKSGTLTGNTTVSTTNGVTVEGTIEPNWTLTISSDLTFATQIATMQCNVTPANLNSVDAEVTGTATLNGRLLVTMTGTFTCGTTYTLLHATEIRPNTTFSSVSINFPTGQNFTPQIIYDYTGNHVYLYLACNTD